MRWRTLILKILSLLVALNYFAFRVELFEDESAHNQPRPSGGSSFTFPTLNWETFDKDNAPSAIAVDGQIQFELLVALPQEHHEPSHYSRPLQVVRDKSPPAHSSTL